ncbi:MAG: response regulator transcription factor [Chthonomonadetes bacterium]|nr:response regulator transcription factor [Chthonomonadetes bacterium]
MKALVVDDEQPLLDALQYALQREGFEVITATDSEQAIQLFNEQNPDLVILDVMLPTRSGFEVCQILRKQSNVPIIMLTARGAEGDRVVGLEIGADDYITKPFSMRELMARIRSVMRRASASSAPAGPVLKAGDLTVDVNQYEARLGDRLLNLSPKEFELLRFLMEHPGQVFSRQTLLDRVWGEDKYIEERTVDVHIHWLREKIEPNPRKPKYLLTVRGVGYKFRG